MKRITCVILTLIMILCCCACNKTGQKTDKKVLTNTPENVAEIYVKSCFAMDFEKILSVLPDWRIRYLANYANIDYNGDMKSLAKGLSDFYHEKSRKTEIISTKIVEQQEFNDYALYNECLKEYPDLKVDEFKEIKECAKVKVDYILHNTNQTTKEDYSTILDDEVICVKIDDKWFIFSDEFYNWQFEVSLF